jgi:hypothetical protein
MSDEALGKDATPGGPDSKAPGVFKNSNDKKIDFSACL